MSVPKHLLVSSNYDYTDLQVEEAFAALRSAGNDLEEREKKLILAVRGSPDHEIESLGGSAHEARLILARLPFIVGQDNTDGRILALRSAMARALGARLKKN